MADGSEVDPVSTCRMSFGTRLFGERDVRMFSLIGKDQITIGRTARPGNSGFGRLPRAIEFPHVQLHKARRKRAVISQPGNDALLFAGLLSGKLGRLRPKDECLQVGMRWIVRDMRNISSPPAIATVPDKQPKYTRGRIQLEGERTRIIGLGTSYLLRAAFNLDVNVRSGCAFCPGN